MNENKKIMEVIGKNIRHARQQKKYTQEYLAEQLNTSDKFISMLERGASGISISSIVNLCNILDIEPNVLFNGVFKTNSDINNSIISMFSMLTSEDRDFIIGTIEYLLKRNG